MKTVKISRQKPAPKPPVSASGKGTPAKKAIKPTQRRSTLIEAKTMPASLQILSKAKALAKNIKPKKRAAITVRNKPQPVVKAAPPKPKKRAPQHDSAYYARLGERGGTSLMKQRGPEYFAEIARRSHPRAVYNGGRPKGSTKEAKRLEEARMDAIAMKLDKATKKMAKKKR